MNHISPLVNIVIIICCNLFHYELIYPSRNDCVVCACITTCSHCCMQLCSLFEIASAEVCIAMPEGLDIHFLHACACNLSGLGVSVNVNCFSVLLLQCLQAPSTYLAWHIYLGREMVSGVDALPSSLPDLLLAKYTSVGENLIFSWCR